MYIDKADTNNNAINNHFKIDISGGDIDNKKESFVISLTKREIEILKLILKELTNFEIAEKLFVSPRTVDTHRRNLLKKTMSRNTVGLVKFAFRNGIIA